MKLYRNVVGFALVALVLGSVPVFATPVTFSGSGTGVDGASLSAEAIFEFLDEDTLKITLINTSENDNTTPGPGQDLSANTLTGVFFDLTGNPLLSPVSATIAQESLINGSLCDIGPCDAEQTNVGGEFRYDTTGPFPGGAGNGIGSAGYVGGDGNFGGANLDGPAAVDGINFGIIGPGLFNPNPGELANNPMIQNQVIFILTGVGGLTEDDISNVSFQYGTSLTEPNITGECIDCPQDTPEPSSLLLLGCGLAVLGLYRRRKN